MPNNNNNNTTTTTTTTSQSVSPKLSSQPYDLPGTCLPVPSRYALTSKTSYIRPNKLQNKMMSQYVGI